MVSSELGRRAMSPQRARPAYDLWRDVDDEPISVGCRVVQIAVATEHGAITRRLYKQGPGGAPGGVSRAGRL